MTDTSMIRVAVSGACGRMGLEVVRTVLATQDLQLVAAIDSLGVGEDAGARAGVGPCGVLVRAGTEALGQGRIDVLVDFTRGDVAPGILEAALQAGIHCVVGTTGIEAATVARLGEQATQVQKALLLAPNFALGAVLMMRFAAEAARYYEWAEIIELHHENKVDAPSGTALRTAQQMSMARPAWQAVKGETEKLPGARGADSCGIRIHSVRLPGLVAHQEVLLGATGETLTLRHDSMARTSFMPGVVLAIRRVVAHRGLLVGLECLLD